MNKEEVKMIIKYYFFNLFICFLSGLCFGGFLGLLGDL